MKYISTRGQAPELTFEEAMRFVITAGVSRPHEHGASPAARP